LRKAIDLSDRKTNKKENFLKHKMWLQVSEGWCMKQVGK
jgi:hypothetical protein